MFHRFPSRQNHWLILACHFPSQAESRPVEAPTVHLVTLSYRPVDPCNPFEMLLDVSCFMNHGPAGNNLVSNT